MDTNQLRNQFRGLADVPVRFWALALVAAVLLYAGGFTAGLGVSDGAPDGSYMDEGVLSLIGAVNLVALALLAVAPIVSLRYLWGGLALLLPALAVAVIVGAGWPWVLFAALVAVAATAVWRHPRLAWLPATTAAAYAVAVILAGSRFVMPYGVMVEFHWVRDTGYLALTSGFYIASVLLVMAGAYWMRLSARRNADEADLERRQRETISQAAALSERSRLAHDLHDVVAHHVSLIAVRAETAPYTVPDLCPERPRPARARSPTTPAARSTSCAACSASSRAGRGRAPSAAPQPGLADVAALVEARRRSRCGRGLHGRSTSRRRRRRRATSPTASCRRR